MSANGTHSIAVISHRCLGFEHPENSVRALQSALAAAVDGVEIDVRLTKDLKWVVMHNPFCKSEERSVLRIHERSYSQLRREVTLLEHMLALFATAPKRTILIDVKDIGEEKQLIRMIRQYGLQEQAVIISWEPEVLRRVHARDPGIRIGFSYVPIHDSLKYIRGSINTPLTRHGLLLQFNSSHSFDAKHSLGKTHQHYLSDIPDLPLHSIQVPALFCSSKLVLQAHEKQIRVYPFQVTPLNFLLLRRRGIDGILTNHPKRFLHVR